jgi:diacylglycerol O-acyltransferase
MRIIHRSTADAKEEVARMSTAGAIAFAVAAQGGTAAIKSLRLTEVLPPPANLVISNMAGPRRPLYLMGSRMVAIYPISAIIDGQALNITVTSHDDSLDFGLTACQDTLPDLDRLSNLLGEAHELLRQTFLGARERKPATANNLPGTQRKRSIEKRSRPVPAPARR